MANADEEVSNCPAAWIDTLVDSDDGLPSVTDLLSRARLLASRVVRQAIDLTVDSSNNVSCLRKLLSIGLAPTISSSLNVSSPRATNLGC